MATLVTGGTGFVGSNIVRTLAERGHEVVCFDLVPPSPLVEAYVEPWASQVTFVQGDILSTEDVDRVSGRKVDKIVHAAVFTGILPEIESTRSRSIVEINVAGTTNLLELARRLRVDRFLYVSSGSVYGDDRAPDEVLNEESVPAPRSLYAVTKYTSELLTRRYGELHDFQTVSVRLGSPYGPMERVTGHRANQSLLKEWTGNIVRREPIEVAGRDAKRSFTYVSDIAAGVCTVLDSPSLSHQAYNNSSADLYTVGQVVATLQELQPDLAVTDVRSGELPGRANRMDVTRIQEDLGFVPQFDLRSGLRDYLTWRRANDFTE